MRIDKERETGFKTIHVQHGHRCDDLDESGVELVRSLSFERGEDIENEKYERIKNGWVHNGILYDGVHEVSWDSRWPIDFYSSLVRSCESKLCREPHFA